MRLRESPLITTLLCLDVTIEFRLSLARFHHLLHVAMSKICLTLDDRTGGGLSLQKRLWKENV